jgi:hypothetical protein
MQSERYMGSAGGQPAPRRPASFKALGTFVPKLVRESFRRRGFVNVDIVLRWREIVGDALARETWPVCIDWPRRQETVLRPDGTEAPGTHRTRIVVGATPARALEVEYAKRAIIDRVNGYLGYRAATELTAAPDYSKPPVHRKPAVRIEAQGAPQAEADPLSAALARLGRSVAGRPR